MKKQNLEQISQEDLTSHFQLALRQENIVLAKKIIKQIENKNILNIPRLFSELCLAKKFKSVDYIFLSEDFINEREKINNKSFAFTASCSKGNLKQAKKYIKQLTIDKESLGKGLELACIFGHISIVKYLLTAKELKEHAQIDFQNNIAIMKACKHGHLNIVKYLLQSPKLKKHANIHITVSDMEDYPFMLAAEYNQDEIVKYLLKLKNKNKPSIKSTEYGVVKEYLLKGNLEMFKYIIEKENIDIHLDNDYCFKFAVERKHYSIINYLIFELDINITNEIKNYLKEQKETEIEEMINKRELNKTLSKKLSIKNTNEIKKI